MYINITQMIKTSSLIISLLKHRYLSYKNFTNDSFIYNLKLIDIHVLDLYSLKLQAAQKAQLVN